MPGWPATSSTPAGKIPPPSTKSSSSNPVENRAVSAEVSMADIVVAFSERPLLDPRATTDAPVDTISSTKLFQAPQFSHLPVHFGYWDPQLPHTNFVFDLGILN